MLERFVIFGLIVLAGYVLYRVYHRWQLQKTGQIAVTDPVLADFIHGNPAILLFTADFCAPCKTQQQPAIERLIDEMGHVQYVQVDVESRPEAAK
ncbi:MAG: thioredoxin family protein, partial [Aggregatilineales bacterium]